MKVSPLSSGFPIALTQLGVRWPAAPELLRFVWVTQAYFRAVAGLAAAWRAAGME
jgi:hypothetical protein